MDWPSVMHIQDDDTESADDNSVISCYAHVIHCLFKFRIVIAVSNFQYSGKKKTQFTVYFVVMTRCIIADEIISKLPSIVDSNMLHFS